VVIRKAHHKLGKRGKKSAKIKKKTEKKKKNKKKKRGDKKKKTTIFLQGKKGTYTNKIDLL